MDIVGLILLAQVFILAGLNHVRNRESVAGYAGSVGVPFPVLAGWPVGLVLLTAGVGLVFELVVSAWVLVGFLAVATYYFHRDFKTDVNFGKNLALAGGLLYFISQAS